MIKSKQGNIMKHDPLNHRLLLEFPVLEQTYTKVKEGVFDLDTPAYSFYEEIFVPYLLACLEKNDKEELETYTKILYNQARLIEGLPIENPTELTNMVCDLLSK